MEGNFITKQNNRSLSEIIDDILLIYKKPN